MKPTHLYWKMHFGTITSDLYSEGGLNFKGSLLQDFTVIAKLNHENYSYRKIARVNTII